MTSSDGSDVSQNIVVLALAWLSVGLPLLWGVAQTIRKALALFS